MKQRVVAPRYLNQRRRRDANINRMPELKPLTLDDCYRYIDEAVFKKRPADYGEKYPIWPGLVGIEVEAFAFSGWGENKPEPMPLYVPEDVSLSGLLVEVSKQQGWHCEIKEGKLQRVLLGESEGQLTFEPGGQLEFSSVPFPCLSDAVDTLARIQGILDRAFATSRIHLLQAGVNPWHDVEVIGLQMDKPRYQAMNRYFGSISPNGPLMMRRTATVQVNLDFGPDDETLARRYVTANLISPYLTAMFANSPIVDGEPTPYLSYRAQIWRGLDRTRTGVYDLTQVARSLDKATSVEHYLQFVMAAPVVFVERLGYKVPERPMSFRQWLDEGYEGLRPDIEDFKMHLSLHFPEVRPRGFMELRSMDAQSRVWQEVPAAVATALLYDNVALDRIYDLLLPRLPELDEIIQKCPYGLILEEFKMTCRQIAEQAVEGFSRLPPCFQGKGTKLALERFCDHFTLKGRAPAHDLLDKLAHGKDRKVLPGTFDDLDEYWLGLLQ